MARRDDGDDITASDDDDGSLADELSPEDEFRDWVAESEALPAVTESDKSGWFGRVFGRSKAASGEDSAVAAEPEDEPESIEPGSIIAVGSDGPRPAAIADDDRSEPPAGLPDVDTADSVEGEATDDSAEPEPVSGQPSFADLWGDPSDVDPDAPVSDFDSFTSDDYLQATTREYIDLAESVARAKEEGTEQIAVSAEMPGLERGLVGLDDVVSAEGGPATSDVIEPPSPSDLPMRVLTAIGLLVLFAASLLSPYGIGALIFAVLAVSAGELFAALIRGGYRPLSIFGFLGIAGALLGTWASGPVAVPIALLLTAIAVFLFYATVPGRRSALENATLTILVTAWIGGLGGFAFDYLESPDYVWLVLALVITVAAMDVGQYFIGRRVGRRPLAPVVSPKKTIEGYVAGVIVAISVGAAFAWAEPFELADGLLIGAVVAIVSPIGDLAVSVLKRALGVKDMGYILPGHGGALDRIDAMIITIPALWIAYSWMGLLN